MERVKGYRKKRADDSYAPLVPFGSDGILIDMLSGLHLEYELVIGGKRNSTIVEDSTNIIFTNQYYNNAGNIQYTLETTIPKTILTATSGSISIVLYDGNKVATLKTKTLAYTVNVTTGALTFTETLS